MKNDCKIELQYKGKDDCVRIENKNIYEKNVYYSSLFSPVSFQDNLLIYGENLLGLKALERDYTGKIKCIYIDPPYNTKNCFTHYDDNMEHSLWLNMMKDRLIVMHRLLREDGFFCCHIDDSEGHYLKVLLDEIFDRSNYLASLYFCVRYASKTLKQDMDFHREVEYVHVYRKSALAIPHKEEIAVNFDKFDNYITIVGQPVKELVLGGKRIEVFGKESYKIEKRRGSLDGLKEIWASGTILDGNSSGRFFRDYLTGRYVEDGLGVLYRIFGIGGDHLPYRYFTGPNRAGATKGKYFQGVPISRSPQDKTSTPILGFYDLAGAFGNCRHEGGVEFRSGKKPEVLLESILKHFSAPGDLILDSFAGSGTTGAVAHKMGRRWIMIELNSHCHTHIVPRLQKVINGTDRGGITEAVNWQGGGSFRLCELI